MDFREYFALVAKKAMEVGYNLRQVNIFKFDIQECWEQDKTVDQCFDIVFQKMKLPTNGASEWLQTLKSCWDMSKTEMRDNEEAIIIMCFSVKTQFVVAFYNKTTKVGWVIERRRNKR